MEIIGHQNIIKFLDQSIKRDKIFHAYLFSGPKNVGKETVAIDFIIKLFINKLKDQSQINNIKNQIIKRIHPDIYWLGKIKNKKNISIEQIKELQIFLSLKPFSDLYKIGIIIGAEEMSLAAANSLLKILEEPPKKTIIILLVNNLKLLPSTIISRCQLIKFNPVPIKEIKNFILANYQLPIEEVEILSKLSFGRPGLVIKYLNDPEWSKKYKSDLINFFEIINNTLEKRINFVEKNLENPPFLIWQIALRDLLMIKNNLQPINIYLIKKIESIANHFSEKKIYQILNLIERTKKIIELNINKRLALKNLFINLE